VSSLSTHTHTHTTHLLIIFLSLIATAEMQNTLVVKGVLPALFHLIYVQSQHVGVLLNIARTLLNFSRNGFLFSLSLSPPTTGTHRAVFYLSTADISEQILNDGGFHPLLNLASRKLPSMVQNGSSVLDNIAMVQALGARCISFLAINRM